jgi:hypothetical protein
VCKATWFLCDLRNMRCIEHFFIHILPIVSYSTHLSNNKKCLECRWVHCNYNKRHEHMSNWTNMMKKWFACLRKRHGKTCPLSKYTTKFWEHKCTWLQVLYYTIVKNYILLVCCVNNTTCFFFHKKQHVYFENIGFAFLGKIPWSISWKFGIEKVWYTSLHDTMRTWLN